MPKNEKIEYIEHDATVESVDASVNLVTVVINDQEECGSCPAATLCSGGKGDNKVTVRTPHASSYAKGEEVIIRGTEQMHHRAVMLATVIPCIALVAVMTAIYLLTFNQLAAALGGLAATMFFFVMLYLFRNRLAHEFTFQILKRQTDKP